MASYVPPYKRQGWKEEEATRAAAASAPAPAAAAGGSRGTSRFDHSFQQRHTRKPSTNQSAGKFDVPIRNARGVVRAVLVDEEQHEGGLGFGGVASSSRSMVLEFEEYRGGETYAHLQGSRLFLLKVKGGSYESTLEAYHASFGFADVVAAQHGSSSAAGGEGEQADSRDADADAEGSSRVTSENLPLADRIQPHLQKGLESLHSHLSALSSGPLPYHSRGERVSLLLRFGRLLLHPAHPKNGEAMAAHRPFSGAEFERAMSGQRVFDFKIHRSLETTIPAAVFADLEAWLLERSEGAVERSEKFVIQIEDTEQLEPLIFKLNCKAPSSGSKLVEVEEQQQAAQFEEQQAGEEGRPFPAGVKVKRSPLRFAVLDIGRPLKSLDVRIMCCVESSPYSFDPATRAAINAVLSHAIVDHSVRGSLRWPEGFDAHPALMKGRFRIRGVRCNRKTRLQAEGKLWKLSRVNGSELGIGSGRVTLEAECWPLAWYQKLKVPKEQRSAFSDSQELMVPSLLPPSWRAEEFVEDLDGLVHWLRSFEY